MYQPVDPETSSHVLPELVTEQGSTIPVAVRQGDKISAVVRNRWHDLVKTRWRSQNAECFGISRKTRTSTVQIIDLSQVVTARISSSHPDGLVSDSETKYKGYERLLTSQRTDVTAYASRTARREKYILVGPGTELTQDAIRCKIAPDAFNVTWTLSADVSATHYHAFSPRSTYFSVLTVRKGKAQMQVWNSRSGALIGSAPVTISGLRAACETSFADDETLLVLSCRTFGSPTVFIHVYSLEGNAVEHISSISHSLGELGKPQLANSGQISGSMVTQVPNPSFTYTVPCVISSVTRDAVDYFCADKDHRLVHHMRWKRETSQSASVSSFPYMGHIKGWHTPFVVHSPSFKRIYYRVYEDGTEYALSLKRPASDGTRKYEIGEADASKVFHDHRSWSDLCMDMDGWLRQRSRRICWLPERYRPSRLDWCGLELIVEGNRVTILKLRDDKRITIRLLNTEIRYFE